MSNGDGNDHVNVGPGELRYTGLSRTFNGPQFIKWIVDIYSYCCGPHSEHPGTTCRECTENALLNGFLYPATAPPLPVNPIESDLVDRWFQLREVNPDSGRGVTPFEDSAGFRTTGQPGNTFGNV